MIVSWYEKNKRETACEVGGYVDKIILSNYTKYFYACDRSK